MYKKPSEHQISIFDFNQSCGTPLDENNEWVRLANAIDWTSLEKVYASLFPSHEGRQAFPLRVALGALIIQKREGLSDRRLVKEVAQNPYYQYFIGMDRFSDTCPFKPTVLVYFRRRLDSRFLMMANEEYLAAGAATPEHAGDKPEKSADGENVGTFILDATCSPSNIKYPQDFVLLNDAREKLEEMIDYFHHQYHPWTKPRTYRRRARKEYLAMAKAKKRPTKKLRSLIRKQLGCLNRDLRYLEAYMTEGYALPQKYIDCYLTVQKLYEQQKYMFDNNTHRVDDRIVSISQPYIRPIVRGKAKSPVEFGAKYDVSIDEKGHARLEKLQFDPYNESSVLQDAVERYKERTGHYPVRVLVDQIYRTRANRAYCKEHGIHISGPRLGRPAADHKANREEYKDNTDRIEVERFFSREKRCNGAGLIMTRLAETTLASIALSVYVTNLFAIPTGNLFVLYFADCGYGPETAQFIEMDDAT
ncbi:IS5 family transposase [Clostridium vitabionis]|uniref:IS5 family transposase n=1 Tax=Clostridium vitabionis TaxID=2784388 RepID=UPI00188CB946|nr:IS5 family transposase [Clostridium vitabionis]